MGGFKCASQRSAVVRGALCKGSAAPHQVPALRGRSLWAGQACGAHPCMEGRAKAVRVGGDRAAWMNDGGEGCVA